MDHYSTPSGHQYPPPPPSPYRQLEQQGAGQSTPHGLHDASLRQLRKRAASSGSSTSPLVFPTPAGFVLGPSRINITASARSGASSSECRV
ncbi:hypothetical protein VDGE_30783 [Verticillium dahliae]|uniref:Uncharacterized protein n=1 Tax=Verticillium dahliae TaxID=27337 RepID=A0A444RY58_VERDA|nr:hypothetical protein VDGE_30783 [Verticillium dahliae]